MDGIEVRGIRAYGYLGVLPEEQILGQWFEVDLILRLDLSQAGRSDRLEDTLDYRAIIAAVQTLIRTARFALLERTATAIAETVLEAVQVAEVQVRLTKCAVPIPDFDGTITIELTRRRSEADTIPNV